METKKEENGTDSTQNVQSHFLKNQTWWFWGCRSDCSNNQQNWSGSWKVMLVCMVEPPARKAKEAKEEEMAETPPKKPNSNFWKINLDGFEDGRAIAATISRIRAVLETLSLFVWWNPQHSGPRKQRRKKMAHTLPKTPNNNFWRVKPNSFKNGEAIAATISSIGADLEKSCLSVW